MCFSSSDASERWGWFVDDDKLLNRFTMETGWIHRSLNQENRGERPIRFGYFFASLVILANIDIKGTVVVTVVSVRIVDRDANRFGV